MSHQRGMTLRRATPATSLQGELSPPKIVNRTILAQEGTIAAWYIYSQKAAKSLSVDKSDPDV